MPALEPLQDVGPGEEWTAAADRLAINDVGLDELLDVALQRVGAAVCFHVVQHRLQAVEPGAVQRDLEP